MDEFYVVLCQSLWWRFGLDRKLRPPSRLNLYIKFIYIYIYTLHLWLPFIFRIWYNCFFSFLLNVLLFQPLIMFIYNNNNGNNNIYIAFNTGVSKSLNLYVTKRWGFKDGLQRNNDKWLCCWFSFKKCVMITNILLVFNKTCSFMQTKINLIGVLRPRKAQFHQKPSTHE